MDPAGLVFSTIPPGVTGTNKRNVSAVEPPTHQEESLKRWGEGCAASQSFPQTTFAPKFPGPVFGISGQTTLPKLHVALEVANLSLVLLRCFKIWTTIAFI